ncbi:MAG: hydrogenase maturation protease [Acidimicrobiales bacterium]
MTDSTPTPTPKAKAAKTPKRRRILVGGIGLPWLRDLDFGTQFIRRIEGEEWPENVYVEDMSFSGHRVLDRLMELRPHKVVLVGCMPRDVDPAGTIRRYRLDLDLPEDEDIIERLSESIGGIIDLDHILAICRWGKGFPPDTVVIEVEPGDRSFGLGFSEEVEETVDQVLAMIREELGMNGAAASPHEEVSNR